MIFNRRIITKFLDLVNLQRHNDNFADIQTDLTNHEGRITGAQSDITTHKASTAAHPAEHVTYSGVVVGADNIQEAVDFVDERLDTIIVGGSEDKDPELTDIKTPDPSYTPGRTIAAAGDLVRDMQKKFGEQLADTSSQIIALGNDKAEKTELAATNVTLAEKANTADVNAQFASIVSGTPKGAYATVTELQTAYPTGTTGVFIISADGYWYYWNGSTWTAGGPYQSVGLANGSITEKMLFFVPVVGTRSKNLLNKATITAGMYVNYLSGVLQASASFSASDYIEILPSTSYYKNDNQQFAFYDAAKTFISGVSSSNNLNTPSNARYVRITIPNAAVNTLQLELGTAATEYEPFINWINMDTMKDKSLTEAKTSFFDRVMVSNNLINIATITPGVYIRSTNGATATLAGYNGTDYVEVEAGETYIRTYGEQFAFYNSSKVFISGISGNTGVPFVAPAGAKFARFSIKDSQLSTFQVNKGSVLFAYDTGGVKDYRIDYDKIYRKPNAFKTLLVVDPSGGGHYKRINDAILDIEAKGYTQKITLLTMPGIYEEVIDLKQNTNISIVGVNRKDCIIVDKSGEYANSPLMISGSGYIANLTIIQNHDNNPSFTSPGYAVHFDYTGAGETIFENCRFESYQNAAVGIGMHQDQTLKFKNCEFYKDGTYNGGSLYFHNQTESGITNQRLVIDNCRIVSKQGRSVSITDANIGHGDGLGNDMTVEFINTMAYSEELGKSSLYIGNPPTVTGGICGSIVLSAKSYGNNMSELNSI